MAVCGGTNVVCRKSEKLKGSFSAGVSNYVTYVRRSKKVFLKLSMAFVVGNFTGEICEHRRGEVA